MGLQFFMPCLFFPSIPDSHTMCRSHFLDAKPHRTPHQHEEFASHTPALAHEYRPERSLQLSEPPRSDTRGIRDMGMSQAADTYPTKLRSGVLVGGPVASMPMSTRDRYDMLVLCQSMFALGMRLKIHHHLPIILLFAISR